MKQYKLFFILILIVSGIAVYVFVKPVSKVPTTNAGNVKIQSPQAPEHRPELKMGIKIFYRRSGDLGIEQVVLNKSGDTVNFFRRNLSANYRIYTIDHNRKDYTVKKLTVESYRKGKKINASTPPFKSQNRSIEFSDDYVEMKEDMVKIIMQFQDTVSHKQKDWEIYIQLNKEY